VRSEEPAGEWWLSNRASAWLELPSAPGADVRAMGLGQPCQDRARLASGAGVDLGGRDLTHPLVAASSPGRGLAAAKSPTRPAPVSTAEIEEKAT